jgi:chorismate mutase
MTAVRAIRGAIQLDVDEREHVLSSTRELVSTLLEANSLTKEDVISIMFTATPDLRSEFPAVAARELGLGDVPLMCTQELDILGAMPRVIRLMAHVNTNLARDQISHVYLRGATALRRDLAQ